MSCQDLQNRLQDFLDGKLSALERATVEAHLSGCPGCRELVTLMGMASPSAGTPDLTGSVLSQTTGSACDRAHEIVCDYVDGALDSVDDDLLKLHMTDCDDCESLAAALARLHLDLPAMAELQPASSFVGDVLAQTSHKPRRWAELAERLQSGWAALIARPRIAWEAGYVGAIGVWLLFSVMGAPAPAASTVVVVDEVRDGIGALGRNAWDETGGRGIEAWLGLQSGFAERYRRTTPVIDELRRDGDRLKQAAMSLDLEESGEALKALTGDARNAWERFRTNPDANDEDEASPQGV